MSERNDRPGPQAIAEDLHGLRAATLALVDGLAGLTDAEARRPSLLPGWTVGHVLTHVARNADGMGRMAAAAGAGRVGEMYPGGWDARAADIAVGAGRPAAELVADVAASAAALDAAWPTTWEGEGLTVGGTLPVAEMPFVRWREVEVHRADLGLSFGPAHWSDGYVARELARALAGSAARTPDGARVEVGPDEDPRRVLAWLLGRAEPPPGHPDLTPW